MSSLDLRDLVEEYEELTDKLDLGNFNHDDQVRLSQLQALERELGDSLRDASDNEPILINESEWVDYCQEMANDCGYLPRNKSENPIFDFIDWNAWADYCSQDYTTVDFDGDTYYYRCC